MASLNENLTRLSNARDDIADAIVAKGGTVAAGDGLEEFADDIATITNQYTTGDEGKVVSSGALIEQTAYPSTITENGTYNTTENNSVTVNVPSLPSGITMCKLTALSSNVTNSAMYLINLDDKTILTGYVNKSNSDFERLRFLYPNTFTPTHSNTDKINNIALYSRYDSTRVNYYGAAISYEMDTTNRTVSFNTDTRGKYYFCMIFS